MEAYDAQQTQEFIIRRISFHNSHNPNILKHTPIITTTLRKISAEHLSSSIAPKSLKDHLKMNANDKEIWDSAYLEEYLGLHHTTHTWDYISEDEYNVLRKEIGNAIPTMALSKIKYDELGNPQRAKYRIVILGNLDPHNWSSADCFAPVLSAFENRILTAIATQMRRKLKSADFTQAFCQSYLPENERYIARPPKDCPITPPNTYLLLRKTLYGLKRSPRHWYETATKAFKSIGLHPLPNAPCIFTGKLFDDKPPIYIGLYVDDFIYFSQDPAVEQELERRINEETSLKVEFQGIVKHFLGLKYDYTTHDSGDLTVTLSQTANIDELLTLSKLDLPSVKCPKTPYRSGHPVDSIPHEDLPLNTRNQLRHTFQTYVGCLNWLSTQTRPDIATITGILAAHNSNPSHGHIDAARHVIKYLKGTKHLGISFSSKRNPLIESFVQYPVDPSQLLPLTDANWGPQDASVPKPNNPPEFIDLWKSRSISGLVIWLGGPLHWQSKRQSITARSSGESEIYAIDACTRVIQHLSNILQDLDLFKSFTNGPIPIKNDNASAIQWCHNMTTKAIRYMQMRENAVRELIVSGLILPEHQSGDTNLSDIMTKEDKDENHFLSIRNILCTSTNNESDSLSSLPCPAMRGGGCRKEQSLSDPSLDLQPSNLK